MVEPYNKVHLNFGQKTLIILVALKKSSTIEQICAHSQLKANGQKNLKQNKINKKFVYLISPNKITDINFYNDLALVLSSKKISQVTKNIWKNIRNSIDKISDDRPMENDINTSSLILEEFVKSSKTENDLFF